MQVLGDLSHAHVVRVPRHEASGDVGPAKRPRSLDPVPTEDQADGAVRVLVDADRAEQPDRAHRPRDLFHRGGITRPAAVTNRDIGDRHFGRRVTADDIGEGRVDGIDGRRRAAVGWDSTDFIFTFTLIEHLIAPF
jgi:hypothetical protein